MPMWRRTLLAAPLLLPGVALAQGQAATAALRARILGRWHIDYREVREVHRLYGTMALSLAIDGTLRIGRAPRPRGGAGLEAGFAGHWRVQRQVSQPRNPAYDRSGEMRAQGPVALWEYQRLTYLFLPLRAEGSIPDPGGEPPPDLEIVPHLGDAGLEVTDGAIRRGALAASRLPGTMNAGSDTSVAYAGSLRRLG